MYVGEIDRTDITIDPAIFKTEELCEAAGFYWNNGCLSSPPPAAKLTNEWPDIATLTGEDCERSGYLECC